MEEYNLDDHIALVRKCYPPETKIKLEPVEDGNEGFVLGFFRTVKTKQLVLRPYDELKTEVNEFYSEGDNLPAGWTQQQLDKQEQFKQQLMNPDWVPKDIDFNIAFHFEPDGCGHITCNRPELLLVGDHSECLFIDNDELIEVLKRVIAAATS